MIIDVIGDDIFVDGELTARIGPDAKWRSKDDLIEFLRDGYLADPEDPTPEEVEGKVREQVGIALDEVLERAKTQSPIGLLSIGELSYILTEVGKEWNVEGPME